MNQEDISEIPLTDSGYPTPRDDVPSSSRSGSPCRSLNTLPLTSTPIRGKQSRPIKEHFSSIQQNLSIIESTGGDSISAKHSPSFALEGVKNFLVVSQELKDSKRINEQLIVENKSLYQENVSLREENKSIREESIQSPDKSAIPEHCKENSIKNLIPFVAKLEPLDLKKYEDDIKCSEKIKKELISFIKNEEDRSILEAKLENMLIRDSTVPLKVFTATATIQVDTDKIDADVQTENDNHINFVDANLQIKVNQLHSDIETMEKQNSDLENRLFNYERLKSTFEEDKDKLADDFERKLASLRKNCTKLKQKVRELQLQLNNTRTNLDEMESENRQLRDEKSSDQFAIDEMKVNGELVVKQKEDLQLQVYELQKQIEQLENNLSEEKDEKNKLERLYNNMKEDQKGKEQAMSRTIDDALKNEKAALEKLHATEAENIKMDKEIKNVNQLHSDIETMEKKNSDLENRLFNYERLKSTSEEDKDKVVDDLKTQLASDQDKLNKSQERVRELQLRLNNTRKSLKEVESENRLLLTEKNSDQLTIDEMKTNGELVAKQKEDLQLQVYELQKQIEQLENNLSEEKEETNKLERLYNNMKEDQKGKEQAMSRTIDDALKNEKAALEKLHATEAENIKMDKEIKYLSESKQVLLDQENNLKNDVEAWKVQYHNAKAQLAQLEKEILQEKNRREKTESKLALLEEQNEKLKNEKVDADELLEELKKGKQEIFSLRHQLQNQITRDAELIQCKEELTNYESKEQLMKKEMDQLQKTNMELNSKVEEFLKMQSDASSELESLRIKLENVTENEKALAERERSLEMLQCEFEEFKKDANLQYENDVFLRDQEIGDLRTRLAELETYPGHTISVSRRNAEIQTEEISPENELGSPLSISEHQNESVNNTLVSEKPISNRAAHVEEKIKCAVDQIEELLQTAIPQNISSSSEFPSSPLHYLPETFRKIGMILSTITSDLEYSCVADLHVDRIIGCWVSLNQRLQLFVDLLEKKMVETLKSSRFNRMDREKVEIEIENLKDKLRESEILSDQRLHAANEFKQLYEMEEQNNEEITSNLKALSLLREEEIAERDNLVTDLRERMESAQHDLQVKNRDQLNRIDKYEEIIEDQAASIERIEKNWKSKYAQINKELTKTEQALANYKSISASMEDSFEKVKNKANYLKQRNSERHDLLRYMVHMVSRICQCKDDGLIRSHYREMKNRINESGLLKLDDEDDMASNVS